MKNTAKAITSTCVGWACGAILTVAATKAFAFGVLAGSIVGFGLGAAGAGAGLIFAARRGWV